MGWGPLAKGLRLTKLSFISLARKAVPPARWHRCPVPGSEVPVLRGWGSWGGCMGIPRPRYPTLKPLEEGGGGPPGPLMERRQEEDKGYPGESFLAQAGLALPTSLGSCAPTET